MILYVNNAMIDIYIIVSTIILTYIIAAQVLATGAPHLFMSSFNEFIGGRQAPSTKANTGINMGLPYDAQNATVWVDTYALLMWKDRSYF
eukprot:COSAG03_NODE_5927_length_1146_cov_23.592168_2_plen_90_part_00